MALTRITEMVDSMNARPDAKDGFTSRDFYDTGAQFGVTCREVLFNFLGKSRAVGHNQYLAVLPETIVSSAQKRAEKKIAKAQKSKPAKKQPVEKTVTVSTSPHEPAIRGKSSEILIDEIEFDSFVAQRNCFA